MERGIKEGNGIETENENPVDDKLKNDTKRNEEEEEMIRRKQRTSRSKRGSK